MTRLNGAQVLLPQHEAEARAQQINHDAAIGMLRVQISANVLGQLLPQNLALLRTRALLAAGKTTDSVEPVTFDTAPAIENAARLSVAAADKLLETLGFTQ